MKNPLRPYPFGLKGVGSAYQNAVHQIFVNHVERDHATDLYMIDPTNSGQPAPVVNMVALRLLSGDSDLPTESLHNILDKTPDNYSEGSA